MREPETTHRGFPSLAGLSWKGAKSAKCRPTDALFHPIFSPIHEFLHRLCQDLLQAFRPRQATPSIFVVQAQAQAHSNSVFPLLGTSSLSTRVPWWSWLPCLVWASFGSRCPSSAPAAALGKHLQFWANHTRIRNGAGAVGSYVGTGWAIISRLRFIKVPHLGIVLRSSGVCCLDARSLVRLFVS